jgi:DNA polymerase-3 subunit gamma/tau
MRDAESTLDQLISFCGDKIEEADVLSMFGLAAQSQVLGLVKAILAGEIQTALSLLNELAQNGKDLGRLLSDLLNHFRNLLIFRVSHGDLNLLEVSEAEVAALKEQSALASTESLMRILEVLTDSEIRLRDATSRKILIEVTLLKAIEARNAISLDLVLKQLNQLRGSGGANFQSVSSTSPAGTHSIASPSSSRMKSAAAENAASLSPSGTPPPSADLTGLWGKLIEAVGRVSSFTRSYLVDAHLVSFEKKLLTIGFDPEFEDHLGLVDNARNHTLLQTKLAELGHSDCQIKFIRAEAEVGQMLKPAETAPAAPAQKPAASAARPASHGPTNEKSVTGSFNKEDFKKDPLIQKALEIFKGQIVEVRT